MTLESPDRVEICDVRGGPGGRPTVAWLTTGSQNGRLRYTAQIATLDAAGGLSGRASIYRVANAPAPRKGFGWQPSCPRLAPGPGKQLDVMWQGVRTSYYPGNKFIGASRPSARSEGGVETGADRWRASRIGPSAASAATAARKSLGYGFAAHTNPDGAAPALRRYRHEFVPRDERDRPHAILAVKVMTGEDDAHAAALAAPSHLSMVEARLGRNAPLRSVEDALAHRWTEAERAAEAQYVDVRADVVGGPETVHALIEELAAATQADEIIVITNTADPAERVEALARFARAVGIAAGDMH